MKSQTKAGKNRSISDTPEPRRRIMRAIKSRDTQPELIVRRLTHSMGYRFRLHSTDLPGRPDLVFPSKRKVIFVNGCFWHSHDCGGGARVPAQNTAYWNEKLARTRARDKAALAALTALGLEVSVFWECELQNRKNVERRLRAFLQ
jgi:DNA mismatch endonuclease (patch repair protein)